MRRGSRSRSPARMRSTDRAALPCQCFEVCVLTWRPGITASVHQLRYQQELNRQTRGERSPGCRSNFRRDPCPCGLVRREAGSPRTGSRSRRRRGLANTLRRVSCRRPIAISPGAHRRHQHRRKKTAPPRRGRRSSTFSCSGYQLPAPNLYLASRKIWRPYTL